MGLPLWVRRGAVVAVVALAASTVPCAAASAVTPSPSPSVPTEEEVSEAQDAAEAAAREVAAITAELERAEARLETLQREVADAVAADQRARQHLADAEAAVQKATEELASAHQRRDHADRLLSGSAALMYMQGGDLQNLTTLALSPPDVMADLSVVLDQNAHRVQQNLDAASSAARDAAEQERLLSSARDDRASAAEDARRKRTAAEQQATAASTEAARLGAEQAELTARLAELEKGAEDLVARREAAARLSSTDLLGLQALGSPGTGPRAAQETARSMMASYGWDGAEFTCLVELWHGESGWSWSATNPSSGAYGIPQALPGWKMASAGSDWLTNPTTQITWGMDYIAEVYGSPCEALDRWLARSPHWY
jgi:exonuclease VII small subunit